VRSTALVSTEVLRCWAAARTEGSPTDDDTTEGVAESVIIGLALPKVELVEFVASVESAKTSAGES
jgi:hypothetical protein